MKNRVIAMLILIAALTGCGDSFVKVESDRVSLKKEYLAVLASVQDEDSAKAAVPKIEAIAAKMDELEKRVKALGEPTEADMKQMMESMKDADTGPEMPILKEHSRIANNRALRNILAPAMNKINE